MALARLSVSHEASLYIKMALIVLLELLSIAAYLKTAAVRRMFQLQRKNLASFAASLFCFCTFYFMDVGKTVDSTWKFLLLLALSYLFFHYALCFTIDEVARLCEVQASTTKAHSQGKGVEEVEDCSYHFEELNRLHDDTMAVVFEFLSFDECLSVSSVSKRFALLAKTQLSRRKKFSAKECLPLVFSDEMCFKLAERWWPNLTEFSASNCLRLTDLGIYRLTQECKQLQSIDVSSTVLTDNAVDAITANSHLLRSLNLSSCPNITPKSVAMIAFRLHNLKSLALMSTKINDLSLVYLAHGKPDLEHLDVSYCFQISDYGLGEFLQLNAKSLRTLSIGRCTGIVRIPHELSSVRLLELHIQRSPAVNDMVLFELAKALPALRVLDVSCTRISSLSLRQVLLLCKDLEKLVVSNPEDPSLITDDFLPDVDGLIGPSLKELNLRGCSKLTDDFLHCFCANREVLPQLETLVLEGCSGISEIMLCEAQRVARTRFVVSSEGLQK